MMKQLSPPTRSMAAGLALCLALICCWVDAAPAPDLEAAVEVSVGGYDIFVTVTEPGPQQKVLLDWADDAGLVLIFDTWGTSLADSTGLVGSGRAAVPGEVHIKRRTAMVEVSQEGLVLLRTWSRRPLAGLAGPAVGAGLQDFLLQPVGTIWFSEEFLDLQGYADIWEHLSGEWEIGVYRDALVQRDHGDTGPIGASWCRVEDAQRAVSVTGYDFWDSYQARVAVEAAEQARSGLVFYARDGSNYAMLAVKPGPRSGQGLATLSLVRDGSETVLAQHVVDWRPGVWYELAVQAHADRVRGYIAGRQLFQTALPAFTSGRVGLFADGRGVARFDDMLVRSWDTIADDFRRPGDITCGTLGQCWDTGPGTWQAEGGLLRAESSAFSRCLRTDAGWPATDVAAQVTLRAGAAGLCVNWSGGSGYVLSVEPGQYTLSRFVDGAKTILARGPVQVTDRVPLSLSHDRGRLHAVVGSIEHVVYDFEVSGGAPGLFVSGRAEFEGFEAGQSSEPGAEISRLSGRPQYVPGEQEGTSRPVLGYVWRPRDGSWRPQPLEAGQASLSATQRGEKPAALWYSYPVPGDAIITAEDCTVPGGSTLGLAIACQGTDVAGGYALELSASSPLTLRLLREGQVVAESPVPVEATEEVSLWRDGDWVVARAGQAGLAWRDDQPLHGDRCAAYARGDGVVLGELSLGNRNAHYYAFRQVETDWQPEVGEWMTHSGLACIAWDYWLTGRGRPEAMAYHLRRQPHDLHLDLWVSEYTEGFADGNHVHYPYYNISVVTCAQERSVDSGYRFLIAGEKGRVTQLLRLGQVVAETRDRRFWIQMGGHCNSPRTIHVVVSQRAGHISLHLNGVEALQYTDPAPLGEGYVGLGAADCSANFRDLWLAPIGGLQGAHDDNTLGVVRTPTM